jgi:hypothetical protein
VFLSLTRQPLPTHPLTPPTRICILPQVLPMVYFGILDHFSRRSIRDARVIGTLLGTEVDGVTEITNYFPVPHVESVDQVRALPSPRAHPLRSRRVLQAMCQSRLSFA